MSPGITDTLISNGVEDIRGIPIHLTTSAVILTEAPARVGNRCGARKIRVQKTLNRRFNSWRASIACAGFIRLSTFSRRSRSIAASSRTSRLRAFHFAYLPAPMPSASSKDTIQTVMSVEVTRSIAIKSERQWNVFFSGESSTQRRFFVLAKEVRNGRQFDLPATG